MGRVNAMVCWCQLTIEANLVWDNQKFDHSLNVDFG